MQKNSTLNTLLNTSQLLTYKAKNTCIFKIIFHNFLTYYRLHIQIACNFCVAKQYCYYPKKLSTIYATGPMGREYVFFGDMSPTSHLTGIFTIIQMQVETQQAASVRT
jgi:hypothetical protein